MTPQDYIQQAIRTENKDDRAITERMSFSARELHALMGLATEVGELTDAYKRWVIYGKDIDYTNVREEVGDLLWYLALLLDDMGCTFEECMEANIAKLRARFPERFTEGQALERDLGAERSALRVTADDIPD
jgi:NTP pyrophosphatase (non-canonical NTP hydrolase)